MDSVTGITLPQSLRGDAERAVEHLRRYYSARLESVPEDERMLFDGAFFDHWAPEDPRPNVFTAEDVVAVQFLDAPIDNWSAIVRILYERSDELSRLLIEIGHDRDLATVPVAELGPGWPAEKLNRALQEIVGIGPVIASKLIARKRPHLYPIQDQRIRALTGLTEHNFVTTIHGELTRNDAFAERLAQVRDRAGLAEKISVVRTFAVIAWSEQAQIDARQRRDFPYRP